MQLAAAAAAVQQTTAAGQQAAAQQPAPTVLAVAGVQPGATQPAADQHFDPHMMYIKRILADSEANAQFAEANAQFAEANAQSVSREPYSGDPRARYY
jgi:hypothetical protein